MDMNAHKNVMKLFYKKSYDEWNHKYRDDRNLYCVVYEEMNDALQEIENVKSGMIVSGFLKEFQKNRLMLDEIIKRFENK